MFNVWYQMFHQHPLAEELVGSSRQATEIYLRHFLSAWSADKDLWTDDEIAAYVEAYSQPGALRGGFNCYRAAFRGGAYTGADKPVDDADDGAVGRQRRDPAVRVVGQPRTVLLELQLKKIEGVGHFMMREAPERINAEILEFMQG